MCVLNWKEVEITLIGLCEAASSIVLSKWSLSSFAEYLGNSSSVKVGTDTMIPCSTDGSTHIYWVRPILIQLPTCFILMVFIAGCQIVVTAWHLFEVGKKKTKNIFKVDNMKCRSFFKRNAFLKSAVFGLLYSSPLLEYIREGKKGNVYHRFLEVQLLTAWDDLPAATWHCHLWLRHFLWEQRRLMSNMVKVCTYHTGSHIHKWLH